ncbi:ABC transporter permease [Winogradskyella maritima]|nr:ABC transporter permease [Winogradskyella maritima]
MCVIGEETYKLLFDKGENAIGEDVRINGVFFNIVGIYKPKPEYHIDGENSVYIPFFHISKSIWIRR